MVRVKKTDSPRAAKPAAAPLRIRRATVGDLRAVMTLATALWPDESSAAIRSHMRATLNGKPNSTLPLVVFLAEWLGRPVGFIEIGLRSHAEGCDGRHAVGFVEGWFVTPEDRGRSIGRALMTAAEDWSRALGCTEIASDTWLGDKGSQRAHESLGYEVTERLLAFRKELAPPRKRSAR
jgi:aminoglycoside 6'-N-acetyltransferase I